MPPAPPWTLREAACLSAVIALFLGTRFVDLASYPIFFFSDEAMQRLLAEDLLANGLRDAHGHLLPLVFRNAGQFSLGTTIYTQALGALALGHSVASVRAVSVLTTALAIVFLCLAWRTAFGPARSWLPGLVLTAMPAWFLHSRTAFETMTAATLFAGVIWGYLAYRAGRPSGLGWAILCGGLMFYAYNPAKAVVLAFSVAVLIVDMRFHWRNRRRIAWAPLLVLLVALPYLRFLAAHPDAVAESLRINHSYLAGDGSPVEALGTFLRTYLRAFDPLYWSFGGEVEQIRHVMKGHGHVQWWMLLPLAWGGLLSLAHLRDVRYRTLLIALAAAPVGAALVGPYITRLMTVLVPVALLVSVGLSDLAGRAGRLLARARGGGAPGPLPGLVLSLALGLGLAAVTVGMTRDALRSGPTWFSDYGMTGYQFGAAPLFERIAQALAREPGRTVYLSHDWTNGTDTVARFFLGDPLPLRFASVHPELTGIELDVPPGTLFVLRAEEFPAFERSGLFADIAVEETVMRPDGAPGFIFVSARYSDAAPDHFERLRASARRPQDSEVTIAGTRAVVRHPVMDLGTVHAVFDGRTDTLARTASRNPARFEIFFERPLGIASIGLALRDRPAVVEIEVASAAGTERLSGPGVASVREPTVWFALARPTLVDRLTVSLTDPAQGPDGHVHLWEIEVRPSPSGGGEPAR